MSNLESAIQTLLSRLEQVTNRLEGVEKQLATGGAPAAASGASAGSAGSAEAEASPSVVDFDALVNDHLKHYYDSADKIGAEVAKQAGAVKTAIAEQRKLLVIAAQSKKPDDKTFQELLQPLSKAIGEVGKIKDESRTSKFPNNLATVSEGIAALGWVAVSPTPGPHINDMRGGSEFYSNRLLKEFKGKDETQVSFVTGFNGFLKELFTFVKKHHTTGLSWNPRGGDAKAAAGSAGSAAPAPAAPKAAGAPPPPPPAALLQSAATAPQASSGPDMGNVFAAINKGTDVTSGLKKVTADMKSKNRTDKTSVVPASAAKPKTESKATAGAVKKGPPKVSLEGNKWVVENQDNNFDIVVEATESKQTVYVYRCDNSKIVIKGKINSITLDECKKSGVVFETAIASCEVVNCKSVEVQCTGKVPSFAVDKTSGIQLYLSNEGLESEIVTSKSDSMNIIIPGPEDIIEMPIPEQYKTVIKSGKLVTEAVQHV